MRKKEGTPYFKELSRKDYVVKVAEIIINEGIEAISIRRIARELECSSTSLYRYFENLDELLFYAQLNTLNDYILDLSEKEKIWEDTWDVYFGIWRCYAAEAFKNPKAFEYIFYRNIEKNLSKAIKEYYEMFPNAIVLVSPYIQEMLEIPSYYERDYHICKKLVQEGKLTEKTAKRFNHIVCTLFLGYFKYVQEKGIKSEDILPMVDQFISESEDIALLYTNGSFSLR